MKKSFLKVGTGKTPSTCPSVPFDVSFSKVILLMKKKLELNCMSIFCRTNSSFSCQESISPLLKSFRFQDHQIRKIKLRLKAKAYTATTRKETLSQGISPRDNLDNLNTVLQQKNKIALRYFHFEECRPTIEVLMGVNEQFKTIY